MKKLLTALFTLCIFVSSLAWGAEWSDVSSSYSGQAYTMHAGCDPNNSEDWGRGCGDPIEIPPAPSSSVALPVSQAPSQSVSEQLRQLREKYEKIIAEQERKRQEQQNKKRPPQFNIQKTPNGWESNNFKVSGLGTD